MKTTLALASRLRRSSDSELTWIINNRDVPESGINDFFDLAEHLLSSQSIQVALSQLDRDTLAALGFARDVLGETNTISDIARRLGKEPSSHVYSDETVAASISTAANLALVDVEDDQNVTVYDAVTERLTAWPSEGLPDVTSFVTDPRPSRLGPITHRDPDEVARASQAAIERAFSTVTSVAEILSSLSRHPAKEMTKGGMSLPTMKRLASHAGVSYHMVLPFMHIASRAGLIALTGNQWVPSTKAETWFTSSFAYRWRVLAEAWLRCLPEEIRRVLVDLVEADWGPHLFDHVRWVYPAGGDRMVARVRIHLRHIALLGIADDIANSCLGKTMLLEGMDRAQEVVEHAFPTTVETIYLQNDLSAIAPGPLEATIDARLRRIADIESRGLACTYRITQENVTTAMTGGESADSLLTFLSDISATDVPQPVKYLIRDTAARIGLVRVGSSGRDTATGEKSEARSYIRSDDATLLHTIEVERKLAALRIRRDHDGRLLSHFPQETVYWALVDARYPVALENADREIVALTRHSIEVPQPKGLSSATLLIRRLRDASTSLPEKTEEAWLVRQLEMAINEKRAIIVTVRMPNGETTEFFLEPTALTRGRLRARDRRSDIERTLPLSHISNLRTEE